MDDKEKIRRLQNENRLLHQILDHVHEAVYATDLSKRIFIFNRQFEILEGRPKEVVLGKTENEAYHREGYSFTDYVLDQAKQKKGPIHNQCYYYTPRGGRKQYFFYDAYPFYDDDGEIAGIYCVGRNMEQIGAFFADTFELQQQILLDKNPQKKRARYLLKDIIGVNPQLKKNITTAKKVARGNSSVMIIGETGTGKELFASGIHNASLAASGPFIPINCGAIPENLLESLVFGSVKGAFTGAMNVPGLFEQANNGTIFFDEINSLPHALQGKLLRVIQEKIVRRVGSQEEIPVNCRIISATNSDPFARDGGGAIRQDLLFRLAAIVLHIPPLRERPEDIEVLVRHFIAKHNERAGKFAQDISGELRELFHNYSWPGNVREMENIFEGAMNFIELKDEIIETKHIPEYIIARLRGESSESGPYFGVGEQMPKDERPPYKQMVAEAKKQERRLIREALEKHGGNINQTAISMGLSRQNLYYKMKRHGLIPPKENRP